MKKFAFAGMLVLSLFCTSFAQAYNECCDNSQYEGSYYEGAYFGGNVGVLSHLAGRNDHDGFLTDNSGWSLLDTGFCWGLQAGYDWNFCCKVLGLMVDWNKTYVDNKLVDNADVESPDNYVKTELDWYATIRGRAGVTCCDSLLYLTFGAAVADYGNDWIDGDEHLNFSKVRWGWVSGIGAETFVCGNISASAEFLCCIFEDYEKKFERDEELTAGFRHNDITWTARFGIQYRFGNCCR